MITLSYKELGNPGLQQTIRKLGQSPMRTPAAFAIKHILKAFDAGLQKFRDEAQKDVFSVYAVGGKPSEEECTGRSLELGLPCQVVEGKEEEAKAAFEKFGQRKLEIPGRKISPEVLFECNQWSPRELAVLEPLVAEPPLE